MHTGSAVSGLRQDIPCHMARENNHHLVVL